MNRCEGDVMGGLDALDHVDPCLEGRDPCGADLVVRIDVLQWDIRLRGEEQPSGCKHLETDLHTRSDRRPADIDDDAIRWNRQLRIDGAGIRTS